MKPDPPVPEFELLTVREAAKRLRCSLTNLYALINAGDLPVVGVGRAKGYRIDTRDLQEFIDENKQRVRTNDSIISKPRPRNGEVHLRHIRLK